MAGHRYKQACSLPTGSLYSNMGWNKTTFQYLCMSGSQVCGNINFPSSPCNWTSGKGWKLLFVWGGGLLLYKYNFLLELRQGKGAKHRRCFSCEQDTCQVTKLKYRYGYVKKKERSDYKVLVWKESLNLEMLVLGKVTDGMNEKSLDMKR